MPGTVQVKESQTGGSVQLKDVNFGTAGIAPFVANSSYIVATDEGVGNFHRTKLVITALPLTVGNTTAISFGNVLLGTFPKGRILVRETVVKDFLFGLTNAGNVTPIASTHGGDFSLGTTGTSDSTLNSTDVNILASTSYDPFSTAIAAIGIINAAFDGRSTATALYLNAIVDDSDVGDGASDIVEVNATIWITWSNLEG